MTDVPMRVSESVANAQSKNAAVVALESTIITHGLPYPRNLETALALEATVQAHGAMPATIAVIDGVLRIGLDRSELEALGVAEDVRKLSRADFASALVQGSTGSTTVAATMIAARLAGIETFATGGVGGVHRGAEARAVLRNRRGRIRVRLVLDEELAHGVGVALAVIDAQRRGRVGLGVRRSAGAR